MTFAPEGAFGEANQQSVFTHSAELGLARDEAQGLEAATRQLIQSLAQANPRMGRPSGYERAGIGNRSGLRTILSNVSDGTGRNERIELFTTLLQDGTMFYIIGVAPDNESEVYGSVFQKIAASIQFAR